MSRKRPIRRSARSSGSTRVRQARSPRTPRVERLAEGFDWSEGPVWDQEGGYLLFSDIPNNVVFKWKEGERRHRLPQAQRLHRHGPAPAGGEPGSNGLILDPKAGSSSASTATAASPAREGRQEVRDARRQVQGQAVQQPQRRRLSLERRPLLHRPALRPAEALDDDPAKELDFNGVYRLAKDGKVTLLTKEMTCPNGIALSPDEKTLYVANSDPKKAIWKAFPVKDDGTLGEGKVFFDATDVGRQEARACPTA